MDGLGRVERLRVESDRVQNKKNGIRTEFSQKKNIRVGQPKSEDIGCGHSRKWVGSHWIGPDI